MNYIELIRYFWQLDRTWQFSCCETRLYFYLVETANCLGWENEFWHTDDKLAANVGVSKNTMKTARNRVAQAGLVLCKTGGKHYGDKTRYQILTPNSIAKVYPNLYPNPVPNSYPLNKPNQTKPITTTTPTEILELEAKGEKESPPVAQPPQSAWLENSNLHRKPKIPTLERVKEFFRSQGGTDEMAEKFFNKNDGLGWFYNNQPIMKFENFVGSFIGSYRNIEQKNKNTNGSNRNFTSSKKTNAAAIGSNISYENPL